MSLEDEITLLRIKIVQVERERDVALAVLDDVLKERGDSFQKMLALPFQTMLNLHCDYQGEVYMQSIAQARDNFEHSYSIFQESPVYYTGRLQDWSGTLHGYGDWPVLGEDLLLIRIKP